MNKQQINLANGMPIYYYGNSKLTQGKNEIILIDNFEINEMPIGKLKKEMKKNIQQLTDLLI